MLKYPYFGRVDVTESTQAKYYNYIGYKTLYNPNGDFYVIDWRAPYSSLFYDFDKGPYSYQTPIGTVKGEINNKRQFKITNGELQYYFDADLKVDDDILQQTLMNNTNDKMKNIVSTIQREQNKIIRCSERFDTLVLGVAGSGKTSIALHRVAYLLYKLKGNLQSSEVMILSPNDVFSSYISEVLPELNEQNAANTTFDILIKNELGSEFEYETKHDQIERKLNNIVPVDEYKNSYSFLLDLYRYMLKFAKTDFAPQDIVLGEYNIPASKINTMYFKSYSKFIPSTRIELIIESLINNYFSKFERLEFKLIDFLRARLVRMFARNNPINIYKDFLKSINKSFALVNQKLKYEDLVGVLFINNILYGSINYKKYKHLVIDEVQDYSAIELFMLSTLFPCSKTIVGDIFQGVDSDLSASVIDNLQNIFALNMSEKHFVDIENLQLKDIQKLQLTKSYRSSYQITNLANSVLNRTDCETIMRESYEPTMVKIEGKQGLYDNFAKQIDIFRQKGFKNIGVITKTRKQGFDLYKLLNCKFDYVKHLTSKDNFDNGVVVLDCYLSKGLEFDAVIIFSASEKYFNTDLDRQLLYVGITRALHGISLVFTGKPTNFILNYFKEKDK